MPQFSFTIPDQAQVLAEKDAKISKGQLIASGKISQKYLHLPAAKILKVKPPEVTHFLKVKVGDLIEPNQIIASRNDNNRKDGIITITETGKLISVEEQKGEITLGINLLDYEFKALGPGRISDYDREKIVIDYEGREIILDSGLGEAVFGELAGVVNEEEVNPIWLNESLDGMIILARSWGKIAAAKAAALGAKGILGINFQFDFTGEVKKTFIFGENITHPRFTVGQIKEEDLNTVLEYNGKTVILDGEQKKLCLLKA